MRKRQFIRRIRARAAGERGFTILETVIALMVVFASLTALAYTASTGFRYIGYGRDRIQATGIANRVMEDIRGVAYSKITNGIPTSELAADSRAVSCAGEYHFESCAGEKIISSTFAAGYTVPWLVPHTGTMPVGNLDVTYHTYVTNDAPSTNAYRVTVIIQWTNGAIAAAPNNSVRIQSLFWLPSGCVTSDTHPFAAPCQPFFYGQVDVPQARLDVTGQLHDFEIDFNSLAVTLPGITATVQEEQTTELNAATTLSGIQFVDSAGTQNAGNQQATSEADDQPESAAAAADGGVSTNLTAETSSRLNSDCCDEIGLRASIASGDLEARSVSVDASGADPFDCPTTGTAEIDLLPCSAGHVRQVGTVTVEVPHSHVASAVGSANLLRIIGPATDTTAKIDRDAAGTNEDGIIDVQATRVLGTVQLGGFPSAGMVPPSGMSTVQTDDTNYCVRLVGYQDSVRAVAGESTAIAPSAPDPVGSFYYYSGSGYSNKAVTDPSLDGLEVTCVTSPPQNVGESTVTWRVTVTSTSGFVKPATTSTAQTTDPSFPNKRWDVEAKVVPIEITIRYEFIVDGVPEIDLTATFDPGDLLARGIYEPPPAA